MTTKYQVIIALTLLKSIPDLYSPVPGSGGNTFTIRRPGYRDYINVEAFRIMAEKGAHIFAVGNVPDVNGAVTVAGSDVFSVGRPCYGLHNVVIMHVLGNRVTVTVMLTVKVLITDA